MATRTRISVETVTARQIAEYLDAIDQWKRTKTGETPARIAWRTGIFPATLKQIERERPEVVEEAESVDLLR